MKTILNLGSGKVTPLQFGLDCFTIHVDGSYVPNPDRLTSSFDSTDSEIASAEFEYSRLYENPSDVRWDVFVKSDIFRFLDSFKYKFDHINADRIFEHMFYDAGEVGRLLDACNQITTDTGTMDVIVPNHLKIAQAIIDYEKTEEESPSEKLIINTEMCNTRCDSHGSIWTPKTAREFIAAEGGTWKIVSIKDVDHKGRSIYMKIQLKK